MFFYKCYCIFIIIKKIDLKISILINNIKMSFMQILANIIHHDLKYKNNNNIKINDFDNFFISNKICNKPECRISLEQINENEKFFECLDCNNCFREEIMKLWLTENNFCPMCRKDWNNFNIYINSD
jgi:hypothetical protein